MATDGGNGEAADKLKMLFDEGFDAVLMLLDTPSLFGDVTSNVKKSSLLSYAQVDRRTTS